MTALTAVAIGIRLAALASFQYKPHMPSREKLVECAAWCRINNIGDEEGQPQNFPPPALSNVRPAGALDKDV
jgi:hypothetical protein